MKKIVVKIGMDPDVKEMFSGEDLKTDRRGSAGAAMRDVLRIIGKDEETLAEFDHFIYWRYVDPPDTDRLRLMQAAVLGKIQAILDDGQVNTDIRLEKIQKLMYEEGQLELIREPDKDLLLLNLGYVESFMKELDPGLDTETLYWSMYAVKQYIENDLVPGGPCDPDVVPGKPSDPNPREWTWEKFKASFRPATRKDHVAPINPCKTCKVRPIDQHGLDEPCQAANIGDFPCYAFDEYLTEGG